MDSADIWGSTSQVPSLPMRVSWAVCFVGFILVNVASNLGWLGVTNKEVSAKFEVPLTPAGWAFSIWGVIFLLEAAGTLYQLLPQGYDPDGWKQRFVNSVGLNWVASWVLAMGWQFAFAMETPGGMWLALMLIVGSLLAMGRGLLQLYRLRHTYGPAPDALLYIFYFLPTSICTAWLSVASAVQLLIAVLGAQHHQQDNLELYSVILATAVATAGSYLVFGHRDTAYGLTLIWALVAVYEKTPSVPVRNTAIGALVVVGCATVASVLRRRQEPGGGIAPAGATSSDLESRQPLRDDVLAAS